MSRHRLSNDGRGPIPMGSAARYACACGKTGTREVIEHHIAERSVAEDASDMVATAAYAAVPIDTGNFGGDTMAHYAPHAPRKPAPTGESPPPSRPCTPKPLPPPPSTPVASCPRCDTGDLVCDLAEIAAWSCGHWINKHSPSIAELFQDMLRSAFRAGAAAALAGESFETWYQREVLR